MQKNIYTKNYVKIIINADDFGYCEERNRGICELLENSSISSTTVMVNSPHLHQHLHKLKSIAKLSNPQISIGLHLNFTQFVPISIEKDCILVDEQTKKFKGKKWFYENLSLILKEKQCLKVVEQQIKAQIQKFIEIFETEPTHIDGHNHVHIVPEIAQIISRIAPLYGIYRIRIPSTEVGQTEDEKVNFFNKLFIENSKISKIIYQKQQFIFPQHFIGLETMGNLFRCQVLEQKLELLKGKEGFVEIMVHPGYPQKDYICPFSGSQERKVEYDTLNSDSFRKIVQKYSNEGKIWNYLDLEVLKEKEGKSALILSKMIKGSGNCTTSTRLKIILQKLGFKVYFFSKSASLSSESEEKIFQNFVIKFKINLILGINITKTAELIYETLFKNPISYRIPYILVIAGTDANCSIKNESKRQKILKGMLNSSFLISFTHKMKENILRIYPQYQKQIKVIMQSTINPEEKFKIQKEEKKYIVFPTSFRSVKGIDHILPELNTIIEKYDVNVYIFGPILDQNYYESVQKKLGKVIYKGNFGREEYISYLKKSQLLINTSESEGMSCSILEAFQNGIPVIARNNEGNAALIKEKFNGFLYNTGEQFMQTFRLIYGNETLRKQITTNAFQKYKQQHSFQQQFKQYEQIINSQINSIICSVKGDYFLSLPGVHPFSSINQQLFEYLGQWCGIQQIRQKKIKILDLGCGIGIFSLYFYLRFLKGEYELMTFTDYCTKALSNTYTNLLNLSFKLKKIQNISIFQSDMFEKVDPNIKYTLLFANMPQTPFRFSESRKDKNGGKDGLKYNRIILQNWQRYADIDGRLIMLYSHMCWPEQFQRILGDMDSEVQWESERVDHVIQKGAYNQMEEGLSDYLEQAIKERKLDVKLDGEKFIVPAKILVIKKRK